MVIVGLIENQSTKHIGLNKTTPYYEHCLVNFWYNENLTYQQQGEINKNTEKNQKHSILYFNPPYSKLLKPNIGKYISRLLNKYFSPDQIFFTKNFEKLFNESTLKPSYSPMPNPNVEIDGLNIKFLENIQLLKAKSCNCLKKKILQLEEPTSLKMF